MQYTKIATGYYSFALGLMTAYLTRTPDGQWYAEVTGGRFAHRLIHFGCDSLPTRERARVQAVRFMTYATYDSDLNCWCVAHDAEASVSLQRLAEAQGIMDSSPLPYKLTLTATPADVAEDEAQGKVEPSGKLSVTYSGQLYHLYPFHPRGNSQQALFRIETEAGALRGCFAGTVDPQRIEKTLARLRTY